MALSHPFTLWLFLSASRLSQRSLEEIHEAILVRLPFPIFRLYAATVIAGIGSVFGWWFYFYRLADPFHRVVLPSVALMLLVVSTFGLAGYQWASSLREVH